MGPKAHITCGCCNIWWQFHNVCIIEKHGDVDCRKSVARNCCRWTYPARQYRHLGYFQYEVSPKRRIDMEDLSASHRDRQRTLFFGLCECIWALAGGLGPILGGTFAQFVSWRWIFWVNLPFCGLAFILLFFFLNVHNPKTRIYDGVRAIVSLFRSLLFFFRPYTRNLVPAFYAKHLSYDSSHYHVRCF